MTKKTPEYPIISSEDLEVGQEYRYGPQGDWYICAGTNGRNSPNWVEAKPRSIKAGDRVQYKKSNSLGRLNATVKFAGERWLIVKPDGLIPAPYDEDIWLISNVELIEADQ